MMNKYNLRMLHEVRFIEGLSRESADYSHKMRDPGNEVPTLIGRVS